MPPIYNENNILASRLQEISNNPNYTLTQANGQRIYRRIPSTWCWDEPTRDSEVFIGRIPHDVFEDKLIPLFTVAGPLYEFRLMINFSGYNRGYGFAMYGSSEVARAAIAMFNDYYIKDGWQLGVTRALNNCRLVVSRIPAGTSSESIARALHRHTEDIVDVRVRRGGRYDSCQALVEYRTHRGAAMARKALVAAGHVWGGSVRPGVEWWPHDQPTHRYREQCSYDPDTGRVQVEQAEPAGGGAWREHAAPACPGTYKLDEVRRSRRQQDIVEAWAQGRVRSLMGALPLFPPPPQPGAGGAWAPPATPPPGALAVWAPPFTPPSSSSSGSRSPDREVALPPLLTPPPSSAPDSPERECVAWRGGAQWRPPSVVDEPPARYWRCCEPPVPVAPAPPQTAEPPPFDLWGGNFNFYIN